MRLTYPNRSLFKAMSSLSALSVVGLAALIAAPAQAGDRVFTYVYDVNTQPIGTFEIEQWTTWLTDKDTDSDYDRIDFRTEVEFGVTEDLQLAFYLADWRYEDGASVADDGAEFRDVAIEVIYNLTNPTTDTIGSALYGEVKWGGEVIELEGGILLQKNIDRWVFGYNAILEAEWEHAHYDDDKGVFMQSAGISYQLSPNWSTGAELVHEIEFDEWDNVGDDVVYLGPNVAYRGEGWWVACTAMFQATDVASEANFQTRLLIGFDF